MPTDPAPDPRRAVGAWLAARRAALGGAVLGFLGGGVVALPLVSGDGLVLGIVAAAGAAGGYRRGRRTDQDRSGRREQPYG